MSPTRLLPHRGVAPAAIVLLLVTAIVGGGLEIRPVPAAGCSITTDDHAPDPQQREESPEESLEDEPNGAAKHAALGSQVALDLSACRGRRVGDCPCRFAAGTMLGAAPIRGPPASA